MKKINWVKNFGIRTDVLTIHALASGQKHIKKAYGLPNCNLYKYVDGEEYRDQRYLEELDRIASRNIKKTVNAVVKKLSRVSDNFEKFCQKQGKYKNDRELFNTYRKFYKKYSYFLGICDVPVFIEGAVSKAILKELERKGAINIDEHFHNVTAYLRDSYVAEEEKDLLRIAVKVKRYKKIFVNLRKLKKSKIYMLILAHYKKYSWMGFRVMTGKFHPAGYFIKRIRENINTAVAKLSEILRKHKIAKNKFFGTANKFKLDRQLLECGQKLIWIRDKRIASITQGASYKREFFESISKRLDITVEEFLHMLPKEVEAALLKSKKINLKFLREREKGFALQLLRGRLGKIVSGEKLKKLRQEKVPKLKELKGTPANSGKAVGKVRVIIHDKDFPKFRVGEILVTNMTTPDYLPLMKKASAIVTDLGGITCHAAIISREIGKPCVIGTEIATRVLKTGDLVEVDADEGIIKKLR